MPFWANENTISFGGTARILRPRATTAASPPCATPSSLLLRFDGNFNDSSANALAVTANGNAAISTATKKWGGGSGQFDGAGDYLEVADQNDELQFGDGDFTIEAWVYPFDSVTDPNTIVGRRASGESELAYVLYAFQGSTYLVVSFDGLGWGINGGGTQTVFSNQWSHIALVRSGSSWKVYVNGVMSQEATNSSAVYASSVATKVGGGGAGSQDFNGYIDDVRIVKGLAVYTGPFIPPAAPLSPCATPVPVQRESSLLMRFDGNFTDSSPNALTATAQGNAVVSTTQSKFGGSSLYLDGSSTVTIPYDGTFDFGDGDFTIEAWVRPSTPQPDTPYGLVCGGGFPSGWASYTNGGDNQTSLNTGTPYWSGNSLGPSPADGVWSHIAFTKQGTLCSCYVNGVLNGTAEISGSFNANSEPLTIGSDRTEEGYKFIGYIDELRIVEGLAVYTGPFIPPTGPLAVNATPVPVQAAASLLLNFDGNFNDSSPNAMTVTANGNAVISTTTKKYGSGAAYFDGAGDYAQVAGQLPFQFGAGSWTIEAWVNLPSEPTSGQTLVSKAIANVSIDQSNNGLSEITLGADGDIRVVLAATGDFGAGWLDHHFTTPSGNFAAGTWNHIAVCRDGEYVKCFWNGSMLASVLYGPYSIYPSSDVPVLVGARHLNALSEFDQHFNGYIDDVRIVKGLAVYTTNFTPPAAPLTVNATPYVPPPAPPATAPSLWKAETLRPLYHWST
jgi:hypothetical protein